MSTATNIRLLPHDVVMDILSRLPVKSLLRFRCVCKPWKILFSDPSFIKMHFKHSINNEHLIFEGNSSLYSIAAENNNSNVFEVVKINGYPLQSYPRYPHVKVEILGSCNGLLLIRSVNNDYFIWNPSTKEFKKLPKAPRTILTKRFDCLLFEYGFGYDEITEDYKVVRIMLFDTTDHVLDDESVIYSEVMVYSLGSNCWRKSQDDPPYKLAYEFPGRLVNGALHWVAENNNIISSNSEEDQNKYAIVSFNLGDEKHRVIEANNDILSNHANNDKLFRSLNVLGGCLCITGDFNEIRSEIWVMKDYGVKESWTKLFTIAQPNLNCVRPITFTKNGDEVVFQVNKQSLFVIDPKHGTTKPLKIRGGLNTKFETYTYVESLISLNSGTFVGQEHPEETRALESDLYNKEMAARRRLFGR